MSLYFGVCQCAETVSTGFFSVLGGGRRTRRRPQHHHWLNGPVNGSRKHKMLGRYIITSGKSVKNVFAGKGSRPFVPSPTNTPSTDIEARQSLIAVHFALCRPYQACTPQRGTRAVFLVHIAFPLPLRKSVMVGVFCKNTDYHGQPPHRTRQWNALAKAKPVPWPTQQLTLDFGKRKLL